jgi:hypothetical protein
MKGAFHPGGICRKSCQRLDAPLRLDAPVHRFSRPLILGPRSANRENRPRQCQNSVLAVPHPSTFRQECLPRAIRRTGIDLEPSQAAILPLDNGMREWQEELLTRDNQFSNSILFQISSAAFLHRHD